MGCPQVFLQLKLDTDGDIVCYRRWQSALLRRLLYAESLASLLDTYLYSDACLFIALVVKFVLACVTCAEVVLGYLNHH